MKSRPIPILILALLQFLMPAVNFIFNAWLAQMNPLSYIQMFWEQNSYLTLAVVVIPYWVAGFAIMAMKLWSYFLFIAVTLWIISSNFMLWWGQQAVTDSLFFVLLANGINLIIVSYFLIPQIRKLYFDRTLRWWESCPRFQVDFLAHVGTSSPTEQGQILDLCESGLFVKTHHLKLNQGEKLWVSFDVLGRTFQFEGEIAHRRMLDDGSSGYGFKVSSQRKDLKNLAHALILMGHQPKMRPESLILRLKWWWAQLKSGNRAAWVPKTAHSGQK